MIRRSLFVLGSLICFASEAAAATLTWQAVTQDTLGRPVSINNYRVFRRANSQVYDPPVIVGANTSYSFSPASLMSGTTYYFAVSAVDSDGDESVLSPEIAYTAPYAPVADAGADVVGGRNRLIRVAGYASDVDGTVTVHSWSISPAGCTKYTTVTPTVILLRCATTGTFQVTLSVQDSQGMSDTDVATLQVFEPPIVSAGPDLVVGKSKGARAVGSVSDPDGTIASYQWSISPATCTRIGGGMVVFFICPQTGTYSVYLAATDSQGLSTTDGATLRVYDLPTANAGPDMTVAAGANLTLNGSGSDPDGTIASYSWRMSPATGCSYSSPAGSPNKLTLNCSTLGTYYAILTVVDSQGLSSAQDAALITVVAPSGGGGGDTPTR